MYTLEYLAVNCNSLHFQIVFQVASVVHKMRNVTSILHFLLTIRYLAYIWHLDISIFQILLALTNALQNEKRQNESQAKFRFERILKDQRYKFEFLESEGEIISWTICFFQYKSLQLDLLQKQYWTFLQVTGYIE